MKKKENPGVSVLDSLNNDLAKLVEIRHSEAQFMVNSTINTLFWKIGETFNTHLDNEKDSNKISRTISDLSSRLIAAFGSFFETENIAMMRQFAKRCSKTTANQISAYVGWKYIPVLSILETSDEWLFYARIIVKEHVSPAKLDKKISEKLFEQSKPFKLKFPDFPFMDIFSHTNEKQEFLDNFFKDPLLQAFRPLLEPSKKRKDKGKNIMILGVKQDIISIISSEIRQLQLKQNKHFNLRFNIFFWEIGHRIKERIAKSDVLVLDYQRGQLIEKLGINLEKNYGNNFSITQLHQCLKFAEQFTDQRLLIEFSSMVRWEHILVLLSIPEMEEKLFYARLIAVEGLSVAMLKKQLKNNVYKQTSDTESVEQEVIEKMQSQVSETTVLKRKNATIKIRKNLINLDEVAENSLVTNNIFKNQYFLEFVNSL